MTVLFAVDHVDTCALSDWALRNRIKWYNEEIAKCEEELRVRATWATANPGRANIPED